MHGAEVRRASPGFFNAIILATALTACRAAGESAAPEGEALCRAVESPTDEVKAGPLHALNRQFLAAHARARAAECERLMRDGLVIRYTFGALEARWRGRPIGGRPTINVLPAEFHPVKDVSHAVFLAVLLLREPPSTEATRRLDAAVAAIDAAARELDGEAGRRIPAALLPAQRRLLARTRALLVGHRERPRTAEDLRRYVEDVREDVKTNLQAVAGAVVRGLHAEVTRIREAVAREDPRAWDDVVIVVAVSHQSRAREISVQYFERLLGEPVGEGARGERRLVVAEGLTRGPDQLELVATHVVDRVGAAEIFGEVDRLQRDAMAEDGGALDELLPRP